MTDVKSQRMDMMEIEKLKYEIKEKTEVLRWYADGNTWADDNPGHTAGDDCGTKARTVLEKWSLK